MKTIRKNSVFLLLSLISCTSDFQKGEERFEAGEFEAARQFFNTVGKGDPNYGKATIRLRSIDSIFSRHIYNLAIKKFTDGNLQDSKVLFLKIEEDDSHYYDAVAYLLRIDSIGQGKDFKTIEQTKNSRLKQSRWYEGGTLHRATIIEWKDATEENKLATCGDFMTTLDNSLNEGTLLARATALKACINEATIGITKVDKDKVAEIASYCTILLGYEKKR